METGFGWGGLEIVDGTCKVNSKRREPGVQMLELVSAFLKL
jgi:hypothetical protein